MNLPLPGSFTLPVHALASSFDQVTNSYKFYWFLAILESVRNNEGRILPVKTLLARITARVWYPINYYRLFFGKQDQLENVVSFIQEKTGLPIDSTPETISTTALNHLEKRDEIGVRIALLANFVPYRFLRPFFADTLRGEPDWKINRQIQELANKAYNSKRPCLYRFIDSPEPAIEIHPDWYEYLKQHLSILTGFCLWHLINYLQKNNPNVPNIAGKLFEPQSRDLNLARKFWNLVLQDTKLTCIYSQKPIIPGRYTIDHFLPWRFVGHDLLWNLIPAPKEVNSSKSDALPDPSYIEPFSKMQYRAVQIISSMPKTQKLLEDYVIFFKVGTVDELRQMSFHQFHDTLHKNIAPQLQIAANMGFSSRWKYTP